MIIELVGTIFSPIVWVLDFLFNALGTIIGIGFLLAIFIGIPFVILNDAKQIIFNKQARKNFLYHSLPGWIVVLVIGLCIYLIFK
tara:strand:+ start:96 stop:350 length:255 start_codon:yes stop_codon:yes gene_type:complete